MTKTSTNTTLIGSAAILLATVLWGMTFAFIKDAVSTIPPFTFLFWRFAIAAFLMLVIFWGKLKFNQQTWSYGFILGVLLACTVMFQTIGLRYTTASTASFITGLSVILVAIFDSFFNKRWPTRYLILAILLAIFGVGLITLSNGLDWNQGDLWVLLCALFFACYIMYAGKASRIHQPLSLTFMQSFVIAFLSLIFCVFDQTLSVPHELHIWVSILFCSIFASIIAFMLQLHFQKYVSSTKTAIIFSLEPVFATITAAIYLGERVTLQFVIGAAMIFLAIWLSEKRVKQKVIPQE